MKSTLISNIDEYDEYNTKKYTIQLFGLTENNETVALKIKNI